MENLTGGTPPVRYLPCVVPCKLYFILIEIEKAALHKQGGFEYFLSVFTYSGLRLLHNPY